MNNAEFEKLFEERVEKTRKLLFNKAKEYAATEDRLHNFKVGARITNQTPARVLDGFMLKHYISYRDILTDMDNGKRIDPVKLEDKLGDIITYMFLQEAIIMESGLVTNA